MRVSSRDGGQILILLGAWLLFGGGASSALVVYYRPASEIRNAVEDVLPGGVRRDQVLSEISQWESGQNKLDDKVSAEREALFKVLRRKDAGRAEVDPIVASLDGNLLEMDRDFLDLRFRMKEHLTSAEWAAIIARPPR